MKASRRRWLAAGVVPRFLARATFVVCACAMSTVSANAVEPQPSVSGVPVDREGDAHEADTPPEPGVDNAEPAPAPDFSAVSPTPAQIRPTAKVVEASPAERSSTAGGAWKSPPPLQIHAFASQGVIKSTKNNYLVNSKRGSFEFAEVGINFTQPLSDQFRMGAQIFAQQLGKVGGYRPRVDWFYLDYHPTDWFGIQMGRTKMPFGLYNDVNDVDAARVPVLLPQAVYPILNRDLLLALTGLQIYGYLALGPVGALDYRLYGGTLYTDPPAAGPGLVLLDYQMPYLIGGRAFWETPIQGLRVGPSLQWLRFDQKASTIPPAGTAPTILDLGLPFFLWLASVEYTAHDFMFAAEYGRWRADVELKGLPTGPVATRVTNERYYVMAAYRVTPWFTPGAYFSSLVTDIKKPDSRENYQHDWTATLRFDVMPFWILKLEGHFIRGTTDLSPSLNDDVPRDMLPRDWLLFMAKTTAYF